MPVCISPQTHPDLAGQAGLKAKGIEPMPERRETGHMVRSLMRPPAKYAAEPTHEIWAPATARDGTLYAETLVGLAYINEQGAFEPVYSAIPLPGSPVTLRPIEDADPS
jgi:hypothetical protein